MKDKRTAMLLALFLGTFGVHRFYLNQPLRGVIHIVLMATGISTIIAVFDFVRFALMSDEQFDAKYNTEPNRYTNRRGGFKQPQPARRGTRRQPPKQKVTRDNSVFKAGGMKKFKDFDYKAAIEDFKQALSINPNDIATHFNIACAYAQEENKQKAYEHISKAVALGFNDFDRINSHEKLAFLRIQDDWQDFVKNKYRAVATEKKEEEISTKHNVLHSDEFLAHLQRLKRLRDEGILNEQEYQVQIERLQQK